jgi:hypothetical protein
MKQCCDEGVVRDYVICVSRFDLLLLDRADLLDEVINMFHTEMVK